MNQHPYFDLLLHTDGELSELLNAKVIERVTLHEWPLSCVQRLILSDGRRLIYKAESGPTVETEFYQRASSPVLVAAQVLHRDERYTSLVLDHLDSSPLAEGTLTESQALSTGLDLLNAIARITGSPPTYLDVSTWERWQAVMTGMIEDLNGLIASGKYKTTSRDNLRAINLAALSPEVQAVFFPNPLLGSTGLVHGDLSGDNIFLTPSGYRIIDWQRPILGPTLVDLVHLLTSLGFDPRPHVPPAIIAITGLLQIHWFTECTICWFPPGTGTYDKSIAHIAAGL